MELVMARASQKTGKQHDLGGTNLNWEEGHRT
jgi:hypothetical protein